MIKTDIASDIKAQLGDKYKIWVDNNGLGYIDIDKDMTIEKQINDYESHIIGIFTTQAGEIVALKDLFSSSYSFSLDFVVPIESVITFYDDVDTLISTMNGSLNDNDTYRYIITFNSPIPIENVTPANGVFYQKISLTGFIAHSDQSMFGNDFSILIDDTTVKGWINHKGSVRIEPDVRQLDNDITPLVVTKYIVNTLSLILHLRKDEAINFLQYIYNPTSLENKLFDIKITINGTPYNWEHAVMLEASNEASIGGYIIYNCTFMKTVVI